MKASVIGSFAAAAVFLFPVFSFAHGGGKHYLGTVKAVDEKAITIETQDKKEVTVTLDAKTKFEKSGAAATFKDVAAGERVVLHTAKPDKAGVVKAVLVKFGTPPAAPAGRPSGHDDGSHGGHGAKKKNP
jgi:hypothetical protein